MQRDDENKMRLTPWREVQDGIMGQQTGGAIGMVALVML